MTACAFRTSTRPDPIDIRLLRYRDRAALRILDRAEAATPRQLATLDYGNLRTSQERLSVLWHAGLLERTTVPPPKRGGAELAYRLSRRARLRLGDHTRRSRGSNRLGHTLDIVETVCSLVTAKGDPRTDSPVAAWLTETMARDRLGGPPYPDSVLMLTDGDRSGIVCLEVDEATQRRSAVEAKLRGYRRLAEARPAWQILLVVPFRTRARWMRMVASSAEETVRNRSWVTTLAALRARHLSADVESLGALPRAATVADLLTMAGAEHAATPVGSEAWVRLMGEGGVEDLDAGTW